ncbi:hypothetical protein [Maritimibacter sp. DP1N21-5]|uniref:phage tail protein n=1 Tax=Maritimibacter sp. DP1N21-5 TaxID=2836867 RepID=UPI001C4449E1|nr:hypothetical protein [Maritimibacter sp. DP1N21-5]MBV7408207.1 hypothetical protein [Maritimibacter sp. DP1N21-5]
MKALVGMLRAVLSLETGAFEKGADAAAKRTAMLQRSMTGFGKSMRNVGAGLTAAITAPLAGVTHAATKAADAMIDLDNQARIAGVGMQEFKVLALSASVMGIEQEKLADILKDVNDKVGDFLQTGAGPMADFFENIAPKVGVTADQFRSLNSADALQLYISSLEKAGVSQQEMTFYMEALASDATALIPVFRDGGFAIDEMTRAASAMGLALDEDVVAAARLSRQELQIVGEILRTKLQASLVGLMPVFTQFAEALVPAFTWLTDKVKDLSQWFQDLSPRGQKLVAMSTALAAALGPLVAGIGLTVMALAPLAGLLLAVLSPMGLLVAGAAVAGIAIALNWDRIREATARLFAAFSETFPAAAQYVRDLVMNVEQAFAGIQLAITNGITAVKAAFDGDWGTAITAAKTAIEGLASFVLNMNPLKPLVDKIASSAVEMAMEGRRAATDFTKEIIAGLLPVVQDSVAVISDLGAELAAEIASFGQDLWNAAVDVGTNIVEGIRTGIANIREKLRIDVSELADLMPKWIRDKLQIRSPSKVTTVIGGQVVEGLVSGLEGGQGSVRRAIEGMLTGVEDTADQAQVLEDKLRDAARAGADLGTTGAAGAREMTAELSDAARAAQTYMDGLRSSTRSIGTSFLQDAVSNPGSMFQNLWSNIKSTAGEALSGAIFNPAGFGAGFATAAQSVSSGLAGLASGGGIAALGTALSGAMPFIGAGIAAFNLIKNFSKTEQIGTGLKIGIGGGQVQGSSYDRYKRTTFWGLFKREYDQDKSFSSSMRNMLQGQVNAVRKTIVGVYETLGVTVPNSLMNRVRIQITKIKTEGLSKEEVSSAVQKIFDRYSDALSKAVAKITTAAAQALSGVQIILEPLGMAFDLFGGVAGKAGKIDLRRFASAAQSLTTLAGGVDALATKTGAFFEWFFTDEEKLDYMRSRISETFGKLGLAIPETDTAFKDLVLSQNLMTSSGRKAYAALIEIAPVFDQVTDATDAMRASALSMRAAYGLDEGRFATSWQAKLAHEMQNAGRFTADTLGAQNAELARQTEILLSVEKLLLRSTRSAEDALSMSQYS